MVSTLTVNLDAPPDQRWRLDTDLAEQARLLMQSYVAELGGIDHFGSMLTDYAGTFLHPDHLAEIRSVATQTAQPLDQALLGNLYYDAVKLVLGCTAFAVDTPSGPLHARNLDWWTENNALSDFSLITNFVGADGATRFRAVGWPGYVGVLSGVAPGRFCITLNAVLSNEPSRLATSISFLIRRTLEEATSFDQAVRILSSEEIATDCLLLVSGVGQGEMVVIERTPSHSEIRTSREGFIAVANDYLLIDADTGETMSELQTSSCGRYERACEHLKASPPQTVSACLEILQDETIQMGITVQQMVMSAAENILEVQLPKSRAV